MQDKLNFSKASCLFDDTVTVAKFIKKFKIYDSKSRTKNPFS